MFKAVLMIVAGGLLAALPEPVVSTTIGSTLIVKGIKMLRGAREGGEGEEEPPQPAMGAGLTPL